MFEYETKVVIDWSDFSEDKYLSEIPVIIEKVLTPKTFVNSAGTQIRITSITPWKNNKAVQSAAIKIKGLESPVKPQRGKLHTSEKQSDPGVKVEFFSDDAKLIKEINDLKSLADLLETGFYQLQGYVDENGKFAYKYAFNRIDYQDIKRSDHESKEVNLTILDPDWFEEHPLNEKTTPGLFEVNFYAWDLDAATLKVAGLADYYRNIIKPNAGVRIYRDNFRVWPYGEENDDWLSLDLKRLNEPKERLLSRNQIFGVVHISSTNNPKLNDQSNREGLITNEQYEQFHKLVNSALSVFAKERKADKVKIDKVSKSKTVNDVVTESITALKNNVEARKHTPFYEKDISKIEEAYKQKINDVLERYMMAAAIGISYSIPIHEMKLRLTSIAHVIDDLQKNPELQDKFLRQLSEYVRETQDIVTAVTSIMSRQKKQKISLLKVAQNVKILKESELKKYNIEYEIIGDKSLEVEAVPGLLNTAVLNVVDNAIFWLRSKKLSDRNKLKNFSPKVSVIIMKNEDGKYVLSVHDNGEGFEDPFELLIEPYYSRKTDGLGLGLFLVNEIMIRLGGRFSGYTNDGATFEFIFNK